MGRMRDELPFLSLYIFSAQYACACVALRDPPPVLFFVAPVMTWNARGCSILPRLIVLDVVQIQNDSVKLHDLTL